MCLETFRPWSSNYRQWFQNLSKTFLLLCWLQIRHELLQMVESPPPLAHLFSWYKKHYLLLKMFLFIFFFRCGNFWLFFNLSHNSYFVVLDLTFKQEKIYLMLKLMLASPSWCLRVPRQVLGLLIIWYLAFCVQCCWCYDNSPLMYT